MHKTLILLALAASPAIADPSEIVEATANRSGDTWHFSVTLRHGDTGWDDYADGWAVHAPDGTRLGFRELLHPHVDEQPFTRSLSGVAIPDGITEVRIRARTNTDGWGAAEFILPLE
jgi:hypothetical protein